MAVWKQMKPNFVEAHLRSSKVENLNFNLQITK